MQLRNSERGDPNSGRSLILALRERAVLALLDAPGVVEAARQGGGDHQEFARNSVPNSVTVH
jgi:hypothetical protein